MITQRQNDILNLIVEMFTQNHEPVGSKRLQDSISSSSATIRNDMAMLEKLGLLEKAHTSSGRMPSKSGFQYFVEHLLYIDKLDEKDVYKVIKAFDFEAFKLEDILERASKIVADLTGYTGIVLDVVPTGQHLTSFDIVQLSNHDALAILTLDDSKPVTVQFAIPKNFLTKDLDTVKMLVETRLVSKTVLDIHYNLRTEIPQVIQKYFTTTDNVLDLFDYIFKELFQELIFISGKVSSLSYADITTYQYLDNPQLVSLAIRNSMKEEEMSSIKVGDSSEKALSNVSVMSQKFLIPYRGFATISLIGPIDMDYKKMLSIMTIVTKVLAVKLGDYYRYLNSNHYEVH